MRNGWDVRKLSEVCQIKPPKAEVKNKLPASSVVSFLPMEDLGIVEREVIAKKERKLSEVIGSYTYFADDDVLLAKITPCFENGKVGIARSLKNGIGFGSSEYVVLRSQGDVIPEYLFYFVSRDQFREEGSKVMMGAVGHKRVSKEFIENYPIPFPKSTSEQRRIVSILDEAFAAIAKAKANAQKNLRNAKELFESYLHTVFANRGEDWQEEKLGNICEIKGRIGYRGYTKGDLVSKGEGAITLSPSNIRNNRFITDECTYISWFKYKESPEIMVFEGDILFVKTGSTYGKVALVENLPEKATINPQFVVLKEIKCNNRFLYYSLITKIFREKVENIIGGTATPTLSQTNLAEQTIGVPSLESQEAIIHKLDALRERAQKLESLYKQKQKQLEELKKSILKKAFSGELKTIEKVLA